MRASLPGGHAPAEASAHFPERPVSNANPEIAARLRDVSRRGSTLFGTKRRSVTDCTLDTREEKHFRAENSSQASLPSQFRDDAARDDMAFMQLALEQAEQAARREEVPVGAVIVHEGRIISASGNEMEASGDPTSHAELLAVRAAVHSLGRFQMPRCTLFVTLEPCPMCAGALLQARIGRVVYGARNPLLGADGSWIQLLRTGQPKEEESRQRHCMESGSYCMDAELPGEAAAAAKPHPFHPDLQVVEGVLAAESATLMQQFFRSRRKLAQPRSESTGQQCREAGQEPALNSGNTLAGMPGNIQ